MAARFLNARSMALPALLAGALLGCGGSGGGGNFEVGITSSGQSLTAMSSAPGAAVDTDAGIPGARLLLTVERVDIHVAGNDGDDGVDDKDVDDKDKDKDPPIPPAPPIPPDPPSHGNAGGWITVFSGLTVVDLLAAGSVETFLGSAAVPAGKITQIRLVIAQATWVDGTVSQPVTCPSCTQTGLKIVTMGKLFVPVGGTLHVTLDFDRDHSLHTEKDGFRLDPVVKIARADVRRPQ